MRASPCWAKEFSFELAAGHVRVTSDPCISARRNGPEKKKKSAATLNVCNFAYTDISRWTNTTEVQTNLAPFKV